MINLAYEIAKSKQNKKVIVLSTKKEAQRFFNDVSSFAKFLKKDTSVYYIPEGSEIHDTFSQFKRNYAIFKYITEDKGIFILSKDTLNIETSGKKEFITLKEGSEVNLDSLMKKLVTFGYIKVENPDNEGEFSFKGGMLTINIPEMGIFQIDFFGDEVENIYKVSKLLTRLPVNELTIFPLYDFPVEYKDTFEPVFRKESSIKLEELLKIDKFIENYSPEKNKTLNFDITNYQKVNLDISSILVDHDRKIVFMPESKKEEFQLQITPLKSGDYILHEDFGIGIFRGIETKNIRGKNYDFMVLEYADGEKISVSFLHFDKIHKYESNVKPVLDKIGGTSWRNLKKKVKKSLEKIAYQLINLYKERHTISRAPYNVDEELLNVFEDSFPFLETPDQKKAINDIKKDMTLATKPMDRVICGDVGFGKTEVAIRASFIASMNSKQTLVLTPTTILSYQHYKKFKERLEPFGVSVENLSRLKTKKQVNEIIDKLKEGKIDVLVGTHKALSVVEHFKNLGLLIVDEEHRFGVKAKEKIRMLKKDVDTLYMSATPIPRTLSMALYGLKDISVINTPPEGRVETKTFVLKFSKETVKKAIAFELNRKGQVFYIHNRIETIQEKAKEIQSMFPDSKVEFIHGRMKPNEIEKKMLRFLNKEIDILISTSIVETGIDVPSANTLIVERADLFGLAQLYHLRGRVGRSNVQAYCYLLLPEDLNITQDAEKRISAIKKLTRPGSGLKVALEDMKIRGAGNILGVEQSGHIKAVGLEFFLKLLEKTLKEAKGEKDIETIVETDIENYIPENFISSPEERMNVYLAISKAVNSKEIEELENYLNEFYKGLPHTFKQYLMLEKIKKEASRLGINKIKLTSPVAEVYISNVYKAEYINLLLKNLPVKDIYSEKITFSFKHKDLEKLYKVLSNIT